jgi:hypothetical protein
LSIAESEAELVAHEKHPRGARLGSRVASEGERRRPAAHRPAFAANARAAYSASPGLVLSMFAVKRGSST